MGRLSQDREERESLLREYDTDLRSETRSAGPTARRSGGVTVGQIIVGIVAIIAAVKLVPYLLALIISGLIYGLHLAIGIAVVAGIGYLVYKWMTGKRIRV